MKQEEITVKGIILAVYPQGEYGKRISLLSDRFGKITVFAGGAAKQTSKIIGACRPFVCGEYTLAGGKNAWNLHSVKVMESFDRITEDPDSVFTGAYVLEFASYFTEEGMTGEDAKAVLNLLYVTLQALKEGAEGSGKLPAELIRRVFELRMLKLEGIYTEEPHEKEETVMQLWDYAIRSPLTGLYDSGAWSRILADGVLTEAGNGFVYSVKHLKNSQVEHRFKSEELLQG